jgi:hypothetical protein
VEEEEQGGRRQPHDAREERATEDLRGEAMHAQEAHDCSSSSSHSMASYD